MSEYIKLAHKLLWTLLLVYWTVSGLQAKKVKDQEPFTRRVLLYWLPLVIAVLLMGPGDWFGRTWLREQFIEHSNLVGAIGISISSIGFVVACWSRYQLGKNWSLSVQEKRDHELIQTGMYRWVRHPIYTGLLLMFVGSSFIVGDYRAIISVAIVFTSFWFKLRKEEVVLSRAFGTQYAEYKRNTKALIPFLI